MNKLYPVISGNMMKGFIVFYIVTAFYGVGSLFAQSERKKVAQGNQLYTEEKYDEANNKYQDALLENPNSTAIQFNVGDVLYKKKDYEKSMESYYKALDSDDPLFQAQAYYNIGNSLYKHGKLPDSIIAYEQALKLNPDDQDAKYNLEFVRNQLKENADKNQQNQEQQQQQQQQPQNDQDQNKEKKDEQQEQEEQQEQKNPKEEMNQQDEEQQPKKEMSKEEAQRLLDALKEKQEDLKRKQVQGKGKVRVSKDW